VEYGYRASTSSTYEYWRQPLSQLASVRTAFYSIDADVVTLA